MILACTHAKEDSKSDYVTAEHISVVLHHPNPQTKDEKMRRKSSKNTKFPPPECPKCQIVCENPPGYPSSDFLKKLVSNFSEVERFTVMTNALRYEDTDMDSKLSVITQKQEKEPGKRQKNKGNPSFQMSPVQEWFEESPVCDSRTSYVYPKAALNKNLQWR